MPRADVIAQEIYEFVDNAVIVRKGFVTKGRIFAFRDMPLQIEIAKRYDDYFCHPIIENKRTSPAYIADCLKAAGIEHKAAKLFVNKDAFPYLESVLEAMRHTTFSAATKIEIKITR